jgi:putative phosphoesterase
VRIGIVSDVHGNIAGLERALAAMGAIDELICAGDSIFQFRFANDAVKRLRDMGALAILGNHEETFFSRDGERARQAAWIDREAMGWLAALPQSLTLEREGRRILVTHGSPFEPRYEYIYPNSPTLQRFATLDADVVILGHTHCQMAERIGDVLVINPGSAGDPRDHRNNRQLSCAVLETSDLSLTFYDFPDPMRVPSTAPVQPPAVQPGGSAASGIERRTVGQPAMQPNLGAASLDT